MDDRDYSAEQVAVLFRRRVILARLLLGRHGTAGIEPGGPDPAPQPTTP